MCKHCSKARCFSRHWESALLQSLSKVPGISPVHNKAYLLLCLQVTADIGGTSTAVPVEETGIAWESDVKHKFGSQDAQNFNLQENAAYRGGNTITGVKNPWELVAPCSNIISHERDACAYLMDQAAACKSGKRLWSTHAFAQ